MWSNAPTCVTSKECDGFRIGKGTAYAYEAQTWQDEASVCKGNGHELKLTKGMRHTFFPSLVQMVRYAEGMNERIICTNTMSSWLRQDVQCAGLKTEQLHLQLTPWRQIRRRQGILLPWPSPEPVPRTLCLGQHHRQDQGEWQICWLSAQCSKLWQPSWSSFQQTPPAHVWWQPADLPRKWLFPSNLAQDDCFQEDHAPFDDEPSQAAAAPEASWRWGTATPVPFELLCRSWGGGPSHCS